MMNSSFLRSSILGKEFINYRKYNGHDSKKFGSRIREQGIGHVPVVIDSVDEKLSLLLSNCDTENISRRHWKYGGEFSFYMDNTINDILNQITNLIHERNHEDLVKKKYQFSLENTTIITNMNDTIGNIYKQHKNKKDNVLYILISPEITLYEHLLSIFNYLFGSITFTSFFESKNNKKNAYHPIN